MKRFRGLRPKQLEVFEQIFIGNEGGHHPATLASLLKAGFIVRLPGRVVGRDVFGDIVPKVDLDRDFVLGNGTASGATRTSMDSRKFLPRPLPRPK